MMKAIGASYNDILKIFLIEAEFEDLRFDGNLRISVRIVVDCDFELNARRFR